MILPVDPLTEIETGRLSGLRREAGRSRRPVTEWHAIPYAAAPVGQLRFRAPKPAAAWAGVRDATAFGPGPMQSTNSPFSGVIPANRVDAVSEDCLTVDLWAPEGAGPYPVLVWVPGGAYLTGASSIATYDGSTLAADEGVVVVSVNYRLGAFGFAWFGADVADSNCGLRDQLAALAWVRRNIAAFGGDPARVTVFGESAGAGSLAHVLSSPASAGLTDRAILQSPGIDHTLYADDAERVADSLLRQLGLTRPEAKVLRDLPAEAIVGAQEAVVLEMLPLLSSMPFHPFVDGDLLPVSPTAAFASGAVSGVPLLMSWTAEEMRLYPNEAADAGGVDVVAGWVRRYLTGRLGADPGLDRTHQLIAFYRDHLPAHSGGRDRSRLADVWAAVQTDGVMRLPARRIADSHAANGGETYVAQFSWSGPPVAGQWDRGAFHAIDLPFSFGTLDTGGWREFLAAGPDADEVARVHLHAWAQFAAGGALDAPTGGAWPRYEPTARRTVVLDTPCSVIEDPLREIAEAWDGLWSPACRAPAMSFG